MYFDAIWINTNSEVKEIDNRGEHTWTCLPTQSSDEHFSAKKREKWKNYFKEIQQLIKRENEFRLILREILLRDGKIVCQTRQTLWTEINNVTEKSLDKFSDADFCN